MATRELRWIPLSDLKQGPRRHEQFSPELTARIRGLWAWERPYFDGSLKDFVQSFMQDAHPEREVAIMEAIGAGMAETAGLPWRQREAVYTFLMGHSIGRTMQEIVGPLADSFTDHDPFEEIMERVRIGFESKWHELGLD
jgi:hypothetical protein